MQKTGHVWTSSFAIKHREEGRKEGRAEVRLETAKRMLMIALEGRGFVLSPACAAMVADATEFARVEHWMRRAVVVATADEIFAD